MSGKGTTYGNDYLKLLFHGTPIANVADNASSSPITDLYVSLHTADPSSGNQNTSEISYTDYARVAVSRDSGGWTITGEVINPTADIVFPTCAGGSATATYIGIGTDASGTGKILYAGPVSPSIGISTGIAPKVKTTSTITES